MLRLFFPLLSWQFYGRLLPFWGRFRRSFFLAVETIVSTFVRLVGNGILLIHASSTLLRLILAFVLAALIGVGSGIIIGRYRWAEDFFLPLVSIGNPIPGLAYAPLFVLWFGLGNLPAAVLLVAFAVTFPIVLNTWTGVKAVKEIWIRAAQAMGAKDRQLFWKVVVPGALPHPSTGPEIGIGSGLASAVAVEMLTSRVARAWLADLRRARVPQHGRHDGRYCGYRTCRISAREAGFPKARGVNARALGHDGGTDGAPVCIASPVGSSLVPCDGRMSLSLRIRM